jgi:predicted phosphate transport protein (TIGR00153 family)
MMWLDKLLSHSNKEQQVIEAIRRFLELLVTTCTTFNTGINSTKPPRPLKAVIDLERQGDDIRRTIISLIYQGAFLPYLRPDLCRFVGIVDKVFDQLEDAARYYLDAKLPPDLLPEIHQVVLLNQRICELLMNAFETMLKGQRLREKNLAIRIYEKKIDDIKFSLFKEIRQTAPAGFWEGIILRDFIQALTSISDSVEDASDHLNIIAVSMR